jgi:hypothetical protein
MLWAEQWHPHAHEIHCLRDPAVSEVTLAARRETIVLSMRMRTNSSLDDLFFGPKYKDTLC